MKGPEQQGSKKCVRLKKTHPAGNTPGNTLEEYGLLIALMAIVLFVMFQLLGNIISTFFTDLGTQMGTLPGG